MNTPGKIHSYAYAYVISQFVFMSVMSLLTFGYLCYSVYYVPFDRRHRETKRKSTHLIESTLMTPVHEPFSDLFMYLTPGHTSVLTLTDTDLQVIV